MCQTARCVKRIDSDPWVSIMSPHSTQGWPQHLHSRWRGGLAARSDHPFIPDIQFISFISLSFYYISIYFHFSPAPAPRPGGVFVFCRISIFSPAAVQFHLHFIYIPCIMSGLSPAAPQFHSHTICTYVGFRNTRLRRRNFICIPFVFDT